MASSARSPRQKTEVLNKKRSAPEILPETCVIKRFRTLSLVLDCSNEYDPQFLVIRTFVNSVLSSRSRQPAVAIPRSFREENPSPGAVRIHMLQPLCLSGLCLEHREERETILKLLRRIEAELGWTTSHRVDRIQVDWSQENG